MPAALLHQIPRDVLNRPHLVVRPDTVLRWHRDVVARPPVLACDVLSPVYQQSAGKDGRVSIEVDPRLACDAAATADMARVLRSAVDRDNMFVKIPATPEGLTAISRSPARESAST